MVRRHPILATFTVLGFALMLVPIPLLVWMSFFKSRYLIVPPQGGYTLDWYSRLAQQEDLFSALILSIALAGLAAAVSTLAGLLGALAISRSRVPGTAAITNLILLPLVVPTVISGLALYLYLFRLEQVLSLELVPRFVTLVAAHVVITLPWTFRFLYTGLAAVPSRLEHASMSLGRAPGYTLARITLPLIRPSLIGAFLLAFVFSFGDLEMSLFLVGPGEETLPIAMVQYATFQVDPTIAAFSVLQIAIIGLMLLAGNRFFNFGQVLSGGSKL